MMYATKSLPPPATPPPEQQIVISRETGLNPAYWTTGGPVDPNRQVPASLARPNPSVSNCGLVIVQVCFELKKHEIYVEAVFVISGPRYLFVRI